MISGYHTAGLLQHDVCDAVLELAHLGYGSVAIRPHPATLNPQAPRFGEQILRLASAISRSQLRAVLDLDAPYLHNTMSFRGPSLVAIEDDESASARGWVEQWIDDAAELGVELITFSSGIGDQAGFETDEQTLERLAATLNGLVEHADDKHVRLALRPRSGDAIATVAQFERLGQWLEQPERLALAADVGEMLIGGELPLSDRMARNLATLACVYLCDRRAGVTSDQRIGHGDVALGRILRSLADHGYEGLAIVRVEGHSELGLAPAQEAIQIFDDLAG